MHRADAERGQLVPGHLEHRRVGAVRAAGLVAFTAVRSPAPCVPVDTHPSIVHRNAWPRLPYRNELISIVSSRPGPTPIAEIGAPDISSSALT